MYFIFHTNSLLVKNKNILKLWGFMIKYLLHLHWKAMAVIVLFIAEPILFQAFHDEYLDFILLNAYSFSIFYLLTLK